MLSENTSLNEDFFTWNPHPPLGGVSIPVGSPQERWRGEWSEKEIRCFQSPARACASFHDQWTCLSCYTLYSMIGLYPSLQTLGVRNNVTCPVQSKQAPAIEKRTTDQSSASQKQCLSDVCKLWVCNLRKMSMLGMQYCLCFCDTGQMCKFKFI